MIFCIPNNNNNPRLRKKKKFGIFLFVILKRIVQKVSDNFLINTLMEHKKAILAEMKSMHVILRKISI